MTTLNKFIRRYISVSAVIDTLRRGEITLLDPQSWDDRNDRYFMSLYKERKKLSGLYALCAAQCSETYHHWRVFTSGADGACLEITRTPFEKALSRHSDISFGEVEYLLLQAAERLTESDLDRLPFCKRKGFEAEEEYRVIARSDEKQAAALLLEFDIGWISNVYLNPWMPEPLVESVRTTLQSLVGDTKISIQRSHLIDSQRWKNAGDRVAGSQATKAKISMSLTAPTEDARPSKAGRRKG